jgi:oxygen-independent coproporphyrinogen-3 oxidase
VFYNLKSVIGTLWDNKSMALGVYIGVPFCRSKCSYCNFASGVFGKAVYEKYVDRLCDDIRHAEATSAEMGGEFERQVDSIYLGGGTPTLLEPAQLERIFGTLRQTFAVAAGAEITVECAPGTLTPEALGALVSSGVNRISLGVQSFVDEEARAVGRLHTGAVVMDDLARLRQAGISNFSIDLIAGLPHQTAESWACSLQETIAAGAPHVSVYMLEIDQDSRLGRELIAGGTRYHAHFVPDEDLTAVLYETACDTLNAAGISQYEISNFAQPGCESKHNLKYWTRQPYLGFGLDAHSFLQAATDPYVLLRHDSSCEIEPEVGGMRPCAATAADLDAVRFATTESLDDYLAGAPLARTPVCSREAREECFFLGLRLNRGVELRSLARQYSFGPDLQQTISELYETGLLDYDREREIVRLTRKGRLLSNEVFERFLA